MGYQQQPGMTGQVKEDVLSRFGELGVSVSGGKLFFNPRLLKIDEYLKEGKNFKYQSINKENKELQLQPGSLCFTYCQVPIIYKLSDKEGLKVEFNKGEVLEFNRLNLDTQTSSKLFKRTGEICQITVLIKK
mgnify:CR=1 FL=1